MAYSVLKRNAAGMLRVLNTSKGSCLGEQIKLADTSFRRLVGLLGKRSLETGSGLLIVPSQAIHTVGMAFPIDVVFVDRQDRVIGVRKRVRPFRITRVFWKARAVIELPAGTIDLSHTEVGDQISFGSLQ